MTFYYDIGEKLSDRLSNQDTGISTTADLRPIDLKFAVVLLFFGAETISLGADIDNHYQYNVNKG